MDRKEMNIYLVFVTVNDKDGRLLYVENFAINAIVAEDEHSAESILNTYKEVMRVNTDDGNAFTIVKVPDMVHFACSDIHIFNMIINTFYSNGYVVNNIVGPIAIKSIGVDKNEIFAYSATAIKTKSSHTLSN